MLERIGKVAYKLQLPDSAQVHPVFHVSQLKNFTPNYTPVYTELPSAPNLSTATPIPVSILQRRLVRKGNSAAPQILVKWAHLPEEMATWEDYYVLKQKYPAAPIWDEDGRNADQGEASSHGGATVTPVPG